MQNIFDILMRQIISQGTLFQLLLNRWIDAIFTTTAGAAGAAAAATAAR